MHSIHLANHPQHHPSITHQQHHQQQPHLVPLTVDISYQAPQLHHQQLYTPIHSAQQELLHQQHQQHHHYHQAPPSTGSSSSIPSTPPPPSPSDSLSLGHQQLANTSYSDTLQSPLHSASSSVSDHSFPQSHHLHHNFGFPVPNHSHSTGTTSGSGSLIGASIGTGGPGSITPSTTPSSGAASPIISGPSNILGSGPSPTTSTSSRGSSLVHRTTGNHPSSGRYHPHSGRKSNPSQKVDYGTPHLNTAVTPAPTPSGLVGVGYNSGTGTTSITHSHSHQSGYISDGDDDMGILSPTTPHLPHAGHHPFTPTVPSQHNHGGGGGGDTAVHARREATRRQRIEAEQRRRDELREGYARLKDVLPLTNQKSSKVSLLERGESPYSLHYTCLYARSLNTCLPQPAIQHILNLTKMNETFQARISVQDEEIAQLRVLTDRMGGGTSSSGPGSLPHSSILDGDDLSAHGLTIYPPLPGSSDAGTPSRGSVSGSGYNSGGGFFLILFAINGCALILNT